MNRTDRMLAILLELQSKGMRRAEDLAAALEVSRRSIYRDLQAIAEAGVPLLAIPGKGYALMEGYFLPPLQLTSEEAISLVLGAEFIGDMLDERYRAAAEAACTKITALLQERTREEVNELRRSIRFSLPNRSISEEERGRLGVLREAIVMRRTVRFTYTKRSDAADEGMSRAVDPYGLTNLAGIWYLAGHCHLRNDLRLFRLQRMEDVMMLDTTFERPADYRIAAPERTEPRGMIVRLQVSRNILRLLRESPPFFLLAEEPHPDGAIITLEARTPEVLLSWIMGCGAQAVVLEPPAMAQAVADEAQRIAELYGSVRPGNESQSSKSRRRQ